MNYFSALHLVVYGFLLLTLMVGLYAGRQVKTFRDYAIANRSLGTGVLTVTLLATMVDAVWLDRVGYNFILGPVMPFAELPLMLLTFIFLGAFLAPKLLRFSECFTMGQVVGELYGASARALVSWLTLAIALLLVTSQMSFMGKLVAPLLGIHYAKCVWLGGAFIIAYSALGGLRAVAFTDFLQFAALIVVLALVAHRVTVENGGILQIFERIAKNYPAKLSPAAHADNFHLGYGSIALEAIFFGVFGGLISPPIVQRMLLANSVQTLRQMCFSTAGIIPVLYVAFTIIGLGTLVLYPHLSRDAIFHTLIIKLFSPTAHGFMLVGFLAVMMSTIDSFLHGAAITVVSDIMHPGRKFDKDGVKDLRLVQLSAVVLGGLSLLLATGVHTHLALNYFAWLAFSFLLVPFLAGIMGLKTHPRDFWLAFGIALLVEALGIWLTLKTCSEPTYRCWTDTRIKYTAWSFAISANILTYLFSHYLRHGAFVRIAPGHAKELTWQPSWKGLIQWLSELMPTPRNAKRFANATVFADKEGYILAFFIAMNYILPFYMSVTVTNVAFTNATMLLKAIAGCLCTGILANSRWPKALKARYYELYWLLAITYCIPFMAAFTFLLDGGSTTTIFNLLLAIMLMVAIVNWKGLVAMSALGIGAAWGVHHLAYGAVHIDLSVEEWFSLIYGVTFALLIGGLFVRKTAQHTADTLQEKDTFANFISHELGNHLAIMGSGAMLKAFLNQYVQQKDTPNAYQSTVNARQYEQLQGLANDLLSEQKHVKHIINTYNKLLRKGIGEDLVLTSLTAIAQQGCDAIGQELQTRTTINVIAKPDFERSLPADIFQYVVYNLVKNAIVHGQATEVTVHVDGNRQTLSVQDNGQGIPIAFLPHLFQLYHTGNSRNGTGVGLAFVQRAVASVGGALRLSQNTQTGDKHTTFEITFLL